MSAQSTAGDGDIEQRPFYSTYVGKRDSIIIRVSILAQPFGDVLHNCGLMPTSITDCAVVPYRYHLG